MSASRAPGALCAALEVGLNRALALEPEALDECARLSGRVLALEAEGPGWTFYLLPGRRGVQVLDAWDGKPDVAIRARPGALLRQALRGARGEAVAVSGMTVEGDAELLTRFTRMLDRAGFDLEDWFSARLGDAAGPRVWSGLRGLLAWGRDGLATLGLDTAEYLREETRDLVHRDDAEAWMDRVDALRDGVDRAEARLRRLGRRVGA